MPLFLKRALPTIVLLIFVTNLFAPTSDSATIVIAEPADPFRKLIHAIGRVETKYDTLAYDSEENAVGYFQIRPVRLKDYNKRTGNRYVLKDMYNYNTSEKVFLYYASQAGPYKFERIAKNWNGSGRKTVLYWKNVKRYL
jgi:hypothetical protein